MAASEATVHRWLTVLAAITVVLTFVSTVGTIIVLTKQHKYYSLKLDGVKNGNSNFDNDE